MGAQTFEHYEDWNRAVEAQIAARYITDGGTLAFDPCNPTLGVQHVTEPHPDDDEEFAMLPEWRARILRRIFDFIAADGPRPIPMLKRIVTLMRCVSPTHLLNMTQTEAALLLNETRQSFQTREQRVFEAFLKANGARVIARPGTKSNEARDQYSQDRKGTKSRLGGKRKVQRITKLRLEAQQIAQKRRKNRKP